MTDALDVHRGAIDQTTITTEAPTKVMERVGSVLREMGVEVQEESAFRYRCIRMKKGGDAPSPPASAGLDPPAVSISSQGCGRRPSSLVMCHSPRLVQTNYR